MTLDAQTKAFLDKKKASGAPQLHEMGVAGARARISEGSCLMGPPKTEVHKRSESKIPGPNGDVPIRIYWPRVTGREELLPVLLLYHGGGFIAGSMDGDENIARYYCMHADVIVINVEYRLAPEHKFPAAIEDSYAALCWAAEHAGDIGGDPARIAVTGESAGGGFSAVMCQLSRERGGPNIAYQALAYPCLDIDIAADYESRRMFGSEDIEWFHGMYLSDYEEQKSDLRASPILAEDLRGLPPALVITAGYDSLRDEGKHYANRLAEAGVKVEYRCFESTIHGFMNFSGALDAGREGLELVAAGVREVLHCQPNMRE